MSLTPVYLTGMDKGLTTNAKPMLIPDKAWQSLNNAYCWRQRILKREGLDLVGRLQRNLTSQSLGTTSAGSTFTLTDLFTTLSIPGTPELVPGTLVITVGGSDAATFTDLGNGNFSVTGKGSATGSYINYNTGNLVLNFSPSLVGGNSVTANFSYYPLEPVMGAPVMQTSGLNLDNTIFFDQTYAYILINGMFQEFIPGTTWTGTNYQFFWGFNYRGAAPQDLYFFVTNFNLTSTPSYDPMRYYNGSTWTNFAPLSTSTTTIWQARIIISYYGRLLLLNTWEGSTMSGSSAAVNITNRCRFSALGSPVDSEAYRTDIFGKGGAIDAPTNEAITGASYIKNTLVVDFETETWQLRYVGEYGQPFVWERISVDYGSPSTFSGVVFDNFRLSVGDTAITAASGVSVDRADLEIPDEVFNVQNENQGVQRVFGVREYAKELVYWCYADSNTQAAPSVATTFPNKVFVYNYRNKTWAIFRDNVTCFSTLTTNNDILWGSTTTLWGSNTLWADPSSKTNYEYVISGNQQGFVHYYASNEESYMDDPSLVVHAINLSVSPIQITSPNHNLQNFEIIQLNGLLFLDGSLFSPLTSSLNGGLFQVQIIDQNTFSISQWNFTLQDYVDDFPYTPVNTAVYIGGGTISLLPTLDIQSKDFNIYAQAGMQTKISSIDFLMDVTDNAAMTVNIFTNSSAYPINGNLSLWSTHLNTKLQVGFVPGTDSSSPNAQAVDYAWFKFYATAVGQYFNINLTWDDNLKNSLSTYQSPWTLYGINAYCRPGGRMIS